MKNWKAAILTTLFSAGITSSAWAGDYTIIDVRTPTEYQESHLKDSLHIDVLDSSFKEKIAKLDKNKSYKLYCRSGNRSGRALDIMKSQGFTNLENLGSLHEASLKLKQTCEGKGPC